jgi:hypothetical protein
VVCTLHDAEQDDERADQDGDIQPEDQMCGAVGHGAPDTRKSRPVARAAEMSLSVLRGRSGRIRMTRRAAAGQPQLSTALARAKGLFEELEQIPDTIRDRSMRCGIVDALEDLSDEAASQGGFCKDRDLS